MAAAARASSADAAAVTRAAAAAKSAGPACPAGAVGDSVGAASAVGDSVGAASAAGDSVGAVSAVGDSVGATVLILVWRAMSSSSWSACNCGADDVRRSWLMRRIAFCNSIVLPRRVSAKSSLVLRGELSQKP